jgi:hypothetical protein
MTSTKVAIIMGFSYENCSNSKYHFPAVIVDLFLAYKWAQRIKCHKIIVVTDNVKKVVNPNIVNLIIDGEVDADINNFENELIKRGELYYLINFNNLIKDSKEWLSSCSRLFLYYSGHGETNKILLPRYFHQARYYRPTTDESFEKIPTEDLMEVFLSSTLSTCKTFVIFDTCSCDCANLPFELRVSINNVDIRDIKNVKKCQEPKIKSTFSMRDLQCYNIYGGKSIIFLSSSYSMSTAIMTNTGSKFTVHLFKLLDDKKQENLADVLVSLSLLLIPDSQIHPTIFMSHPQGTIIPPWMTSPTMINIYFDHINQTFCINS